MRELIGGGDRMRCRSCLHATSYTGAKMACSKLVTVQINPEFGCRLWERRA
jgi:hypothetical protein